MVEIRQAITCSFQELLHAWNNGFSGYSVDVQMDADKFVQRVASERLSLDHSFVAFDRGDPVSDMKQVWMKKDKQGLKRTLVCFFLCPLLKEWVL